GCERHVVEGTGAGIIGALAVADVGIERAGLVLVVAHEVHEAVVPSAAHLQVLRRLARIQPVAGKIERGPRPLVQADDLGVEGARGLEVVRADRIVVDAFDVHFPGSYSTLILFSLRKSPQACVSARTCSLNSCDEAESETVMSCFASISFISGLDSTAII